MLKVYQRIRTILCQMWAITPFEFDRRQANGEITLQDAIGTLECAIATNPIQGEFITRWIYKEQIEVIEAKNMARARRRAELEGFIKMLSTVKGDAEVIERNRQAAMKELADLNNNG